ncbi:hypothetical protein PF010_g31232 [Phytophthora fragariae]|uniref:Uncharacterized protein n=1 Tax=Phytophthora fragariae TaxID=53985 RepID=A0A6A3PHT2_9STRA|nr:hypothetical protein PF003_g39008 [Phytophthora fragariae]KAE9057486.1 hypothetical protein PF007_g31631 [Phytophthora fragariae]KAE9057812.1 hypothetical protein PF010_g31232 [Phytophthora fragariae]KAE9162334.1 hypothetical protein PF002_g32141 [Phytophthora fragariae]
MGTLDHRAAERSDSGTPLANMLPSAAKAAPAAEGGPTGGYCGPQGPPFIKFTNIALRVVQRADGASGTEA